MKKLLTITGILITFFSVTEAQYKVIPNKPYSVLSSTPGFISINELTGGYGLNTNSTPDSDYFFGFTTIVGYQVNSSFTAGAGTGLSFYDTNLLVPLFLDFRYYFMPKQISPYIYADGGVLLKFSNLDESKLFLNPGLGARYSLGRRLAVNAGIGILTQVDSDNRASFAIVKIGGVYVF